MNLGHRIKELRLEKGLTQTQLGEILGVQQAAIRKYEYNEIDLPQSKLEILSKTFDVSTDYLLGKTDFRKPEERTSTWDDFDKIHNPNGKLAKETATFEKVLSKIPFFDVPVSAGTGTWLSEGYEYTYIDAEDVPPQADFALRVRGDSMLPMYEDNDIVFVKANVIVESGQIGVFCLNGEGYLKMLQGNKLISLNKNYKPVVVEEWDSFFCAGRVIGKATISQIERNSHEKESKIS